MATIWGGVVPDFDDDNLFLWEFASDASDSFGNFNSTLKEGANVTGGMCYIDRNNSVNERIEIFDQNLALGSDFSIMFDMSNVTMTNARFFYLVSNDKLDIKPEGTKIRVTLRDSDGNYHNYTGSIDIPANDENWSFALAFSAGVSLKTWINGVLDIDTTPDDIYADNGNNTIQVPRQGNAFVGSIDNICMFNALITQTEVDAWMNFSSGTNLKINIGDSWKAVAGMQINIGDAWKPVAGAKVNIGDSWKTIF